MDEQTISETTPYALQTFTPQRNRKGLALCLSGGGFRAALFHLGALRRMNEFGLLPQINTISSVSGGSIISAHLASRLPYLESRDGMYLNWEEAVAAPFRRFASRNIRTPAILRRLWPWNWFNSAAGVEALMTLYEQRLTDLRLRDLPDAPHFVFCATDLTFGVNWIFKKNTVGDYQAGRARTPEQWTVARAVAASSCFPPVFDPLPVGLLPSELKGGSARGQKGRDECVAGLELNDGGNYDNLGLEPVWKTHRYVLVSDGGEVFQFQSDRNLIWRLQRYVSVMENQVGALRRRWLIAGFIKGMLQGTYWGIASVRKDYGVSSAIQSYSPELVKTVIARIRTDLDAFSPAEAAVLENHGYIMAETALRKHTPELLPQPDALFSLPHSEWMREEKVRAALRRSNLRKFPFGRF